MRSKLPKKKQQNSITEEEIRQRAHKIWEARNSRSDAIDDWNAAIESLELERSSALKRIFTKHSRVVETFLKQFTNPNDRNFALDIVKTFVSFFGLSATAIAAIGLYLTYQNNNERLITERFSKSVEQLGSDKLQVRLGGIYALERISKESKKDYWNIMEVLSGFVRERSAEVNKKLADSKVNAKEVKTTGAQKKELQLEKEQQFISTPTDIEAVATVLKRREGVFGNGEPVGLDLRRTYLRQIDFNSAQLKRANLRGAYLEGANLERAKLGRAKLGGANLWEVNLGSAYLWGANLREANLGGANLGGAYLEGVNLEGANLGGANLEGTTFGCIEEIDYITECTNLQGAADLSLKQVKKAKNWNQACYDLEVRKQLGLPPDNPKGCR
jgi:uncharacterized protein YjbI with pentapeptide repeats